MSQGASPSRRGLSLRTALVLAGAVGLLGYCAKGEFDERQARRDAEAVAAAALGYKDRNGRFPASLAEIGFNRDDLRRWYLSYELDKDGTARLFYSAQNRWLVAWHYDFASKKWRPAD